MNAIERFDRTAVAMATAPAVVWWDRAGERTATFGALAADSRRIAAAFRAAGLLPGDALLVLLPVTGTFFAVTAALLRAGLVGIFVDPLDWRATLVAARRQARVRGLVGTPLACALRPFLTGLRGLPLAFVAGRCPGAHALRDASALPPFDAVDVPAEAPALVSFTTGTTGPPKGVVRTHGVLDASAEALALRLALAPGETHLAVLPFVVLANLVSGVTSVVPPGDLRHPGRLDPAALARIVRQRQVTALVASPGIARRLALHATATEALDSLRRIYVGGAPVLPPLLDLLGEAVPLARVEAIYGATEVEPIASVPAADFGPAERAAIARGDGLLAGVPCAGIDLRVVREARGSPLGPCSADAFAAMTMAAGAIGEIVVAGARVSPAYLTEAANAAAKIHVGSVRWHRTGDTGHLDGAGRLWLTGRGAQCATVGNGVVHALQVEAALAGDRDVGQAAYLEHRGARVLVLQPADARAGLSAETIAAICHRVAFAAADEVALVRRVPMDARHAAKTDYRTLAADLDADRVLARVRTHGP